MQRSYAIIKKEDVQSIDFSEVLETGPETLRYSVDGSLTFVKWAGPSVPVCIQNLQPQPPILDHESMLLALAGPSWTVGTSGSGINI